MPYLTPESIPTAALCRRLRIPDNILILAAVNGAIAELTKAYNWEQFGAITPEQIAQAMLEMFDAYVESDISCMIGAIIHWPNQVIPANCLPCDGSSHNRVDYPDLYAALDNAYHTSADTFITPDMRERVLISPTSFASINSTGGNDTINLTVNQLPAHSHSVENPFEGLAVAPGELPVLVPSFFPGLTGDTGIGADINIQNKYRKIPCVIIAK